MKRLSLTFLAALVVLWAQGGVQFDAGADLRLRQEMMQNVPGLPGGGVLNSNVRNDFQQHMRFRPRVWGEVKGTTENGGAWRLFTRLTDEFRWCPEPYKNAQTFPGEVILDNLFLEGKGLFDEFLDLRIGRQDLMGYCGLNHVFFDGTPGDGSRTVYTDMANVRLHMTETSALDLSALYDFDDSDVRWGTERSKHATSLTGLGGGAELEMDDFGYGTVWNSKLTPSIPYQVFLIEKDTRTFHRKGVKHPWTRRDLLGAKLMPKLDEEWSLQLEAMGQIGRNGENDTLTGWSSFAGVNWKESTASSVRPFGLFGYHFMSGDEDAAEEDGGHSAWDPMWARSVNDSEMFLYGTHYGAAWWSNLHAIKFSGGLEFGPAHRLTATLEPMFAAAKDGLGGGDGAFKGLLSQVRYDFPLWLADRAKGERFEVVGHVLAEFFNPGDYFETDRPAFFFRWQLEFRF